MARAAAFAAPGLGNDTASSCCLKGCRHPMGIQFLDSFQLFLSISGGTVGGRFEIDPLRILAWILSLIHFSEIY